MAAAIIAAAILIPGIPRFKWLMFPATDAGAITEIVRVPMGSDVMPALPLPFIAHRRPASWNGA